MGAKCSKGDSGPPVPEFDVSTIEMVKRDWQKFMVNPLENGMEAFLIMLQNNSDEIKTSFDVTDKTDEEIEDAANIIKYAEEVIMMLDAICTSIDNKAALRKALKVIPEKHWKRVLPPRTIFLFKDGLLKVMKDHQIIDPDDEDKWKQFLETALQDFEDKTNPSKD